MPEQILTVGDNWVKVTSQRPSFITFQARPIGISGGGVPIERHWTQDLDNGASVIFGVEALVMMPASVVFADRAQIYQSLPTVPGARYRVEIDVDTLPSSGLSMLVFDLLPTPALFTSQAVTTTGVTSLEFVAPGTASRVFVRLEGTNELARMNSITISASGGDTVLHEQNYPHTRGCLLVARGGEQEPPTGAGLVIANNGDANPVPFTLADLGPGAAGDNIWCRWEGPSAAELWVSWSKR